MNTESQYRQYGVAALIMAALGVCTLPQAQAQTQPVAQPRPDTAASSTAFYAFGGFAALYAEENSQLQGEHGSPVNLIADRKSVV